MQSQLPTFDLIDEDSQGLPINLTQVPREKRQYRKKATNLHPDRLVVQGQTFVKQGTTADAADAQMKRIEGANKRRNQGKPRHADWKKTKRGWQTAERETKCPKITTYYKITKQELLLSDLKEAVKSSMTQSVAENRKSSMAQPVAENRPDDLIIV